MRSRVVALVAGGILWALCGLAVDIGTDQVVTKTAEAQLALVDGGRYDDFYDGATKRFQQGNIRSLWASYFEANRAGLGPLVERKAESLAFHSATVVFRSSFKNADVAERVTLVEVTPGTWKVDGYSYERKKGNRVSGLPPTPPPGVVGGVPSGVLGAAPPSPPPPSLPPGAVRVGGRVREPARLKYVAPVYPARAKQSRVQGVVVLECTISPEGKVTSTRVVRSVPLLDAAAQAAVAQWEYEPTRVDGKAVPVIMTVTVRFSLR